MPWQLFAYRDVGSPPQAIANGVAWNPANQHWCIKSKKLNTHFVVDSNSDKIVTTSALKWGDANTQALASTYNNTPGYMATVTVPAEHNFLYNAFGYMLVYIGGSDAQTEGSY